MVTLHVRRLTSSVPIAGSRVYPKDLAEYDVHRASTLLRRQGALFYDSVEDREISGRPYTRVWSKYLSYVKWSELKKSIHRDRKNPVLVFSFFPIFTDTNSPTYAIGEDNIAAIYPYQYREGFRHRVIVHEFGHSRWRLRHHDDVCIMKSSRYREFCDSCIERING